jgi:hypothetical protein
MNDVTEQAVIDFQRQREAFVARAKNFNPEAAGEAARLRADLLLTHATIDNKKPFRRRTE